MIRILASDFNNYEKRDGQKIAHPMDNSNGIVDQIKSSLKDYKKIVFVASNMDNSHENVLVYANILFDSMKMVGINFDEYLVLDGENRKRADEYIMNASLVFLCGGDTYKQHEFFIEINLKELLKNYQGIVIGQSAGALNMADKVFNSPEEQENSEPVFYDGLGLTNINIEPHFVYDTLNFDDNEKYQRDAIIKESFNRFIYGQCNGSHIFIDNNDIATIYGETYLIHNGNIGYICKNGSNIIINNVIEDKKMK